MQKGAWWCDNDIGAREENNCRLIGSRDVGGTADWEGVKVFTFVGGRITTVLLQ